MWVQANSKRRAPEARRFSIKQDSEAFVGYFDQMQERLEALASMDDLLSGMYGTCLQNYIHHMILGMLSKSKGQVLRISVALHVLFQVKQNTSDNDKTDNNDDDETDNTDHNIQKDESTNQCSN